MLRQDGENSARTSGYYKNWMNSIITGNGLQNYNTWIVRGFKKGNQKTTSYEHKVNGII